MKAILFVSVVLAAPSPLLAADATSGPLWLAPQVWAAFVGAFLAGALSFASGISAHRRQAKADYKHWVREKLFQAYSDAFYYLIKLSISSESHSTDNKDVRQHFSEAQRNLNLLRGYHSRTSTATELQDATKKLECNYKKTKELSDASDEALKTLKAVFEKDDRVQFGKDAKP